MGLVAAVVVLRRGRQAPVTVLVAALAGALASSLLAAGTGSALPPTQAAEAAHVTLTAWVVVLVQPFVVSVVVALVTLADVLARWTGHPDLGPFPPVRRNCDGVATRSRPRSHAV